MANGHGPNSTKKKQNVSQLMLLTTEAGVKEMIQSLGLLSLVSLLLALGSLVFLLKIIPDGPEIGKTMKKHRHMGRLKSQNPGTAVLAPGAQQTVRFEHESP